MKLLAAFDSATSAYKPIELYDLNRDRAEKQNLLSDTKHADTVAELMAYLNATLARDAVNRTTSADSDDDPE
jgi:hypothetical protein